MVSVEEARRELARRELARRRGEAQAAPAASREEQPGWLEDVLSSTVSGLRSGGEMALGAAGDVAGVNAQAAGWLAEQLGASPEVASGVGEGAKFLSFPGSGIGTLAPTTEDIQEHATNPVLGKGYDPETTGGAYAKTIAEFLPGMAFGKGGLVRRAIGNVIAPGIGSEAAGQMSKGEWYEPYSRIVGALLGGLAPDLARRGITPFPNTPERDRLANILMDEGVELTGGQRSGSERLRYKESELGGMAAQEFGQQQGEQFTRAALKRAGIDAPLATAEVMDAAYKRIGGDFDRLSAQTNVPFDQQLQNDLLTAVSDYQGVAAAPAPIVERMMNRAAQLAGQNGGTLAGEAYKNLRSEISDNIKRADGTTQIALRELQEALDDAVERSMSPQTLAEWQTARRQYRNLLTLTEAAAKNGEGTAAGILSPAGLRAATQMTQGKRNYVRGQGDFADLARAGEGVLKPMPNSGTAQRLSARLPGIAAMLGMAGGSAAGSVVGQDMTGAIIGALLGGGLPKAAGMGMLSKAGRAYLGNQVMRTPVSDPKIAAIISALTAARESNKLQLPGSSGLKPKN